MATEVSAVSLVRGGPVDRLERRLGLVREGELGARCAAVAAALGWAPLLVLAALAGRADGTSTLDPFLRSFGAHARSLLAVPVLLIMDGLVDARVTRAVRRLRQELVVAGHADALDALVRRLVRRQSSAAVEGLLLAGAWSASAFRLGSLRSASAAWRVLLQDGATQLSPAGSWFFAVSQPLFLFLCLRWIWRYLLWAQFLGGVAGLPLQLTPTHPDHAGGLGFLADVQATFSPLAFAISLVVAAAWASDIRWEGADVRTFQGPLALFVVVVLAALLVPLTAFSPALRRLRLDGLGRFDTFAGSLSRQFDRRWLLLEPPEQTLTSDVSTQFDLGGIYDSVHRTRPVPFGLPHVGTIVAAAVAPMLFPLAMTVSLDQLLGKLVRAVL